MDKLRIIYLGIPTEVDKALLQGTGDRIVDKFLHWVQQEYASVDANIHRAVFKIGTTRSTLNRKLSQHRLPTSKQLLNIYRIKVAQLHMIENCSTHVWHAVGFANHSHFIQVFKKITRFTPAEFLKDKMNELQ